MADCEGSSSDDDEDYLPDENVSEDDSGDGDSASKKSTTTASNSSRVRKKGGIKHDDDEDSHDDSGSGTNRKEWEEEEMLMKQQKEEAAKKAREEEIWTSFKKDTSFKPALKSTSSKTLPSSSDSKMSITRTYDFAGEAIRVTKTVDLSSEEAKNVKRDEGIEKNEATTLLKPVGIKSREVEGSPVFLGKFQRNPRSVLWRSQNLTGRHLKTRKELKMNYETLTKTGIWRNKHFFNEQMNDNLR
ncbi:craniofacial development protein 1-like isoform X2 [Acropora muricata]|uniref:craniofacial development protein 1-like isoform X2 n=1 Tax=Acropora muricata TaxID=159855 RepID=UPI0034E45582